MTRLTEFLFPAPARRTLPSIVRWWEGRRLAYNLAVGAAGMVTLVGVTVILAAHPFQDGPFWIIPWEPVLAFGLGANLFYSLGAMVEWAVHRLGRGTVLPVGPGLYRMGLTFSVGLALFPLMALGVVAAVTLILAALGLA